MKLIDTHAHLNFEQYDADRAAAIGRCRQVGIGVINVGTDLATSVVALKLAEENEEMWATAGLHPTDVAQGWEAPAFRKLAEHSKTVAIGECGLDYFHVKSDSELAHQAEIFNQQIDLANAVGKPLMLHIRNAYSDALAILKNNLPAKRGTAHFFTGTWAEGKQFLDLGFTLSFPGVITFTRQYDEVVRNCPLEMMLTETDSPFAAPMPHRGQRNEPSYVVAVVQRIAELKGLTYDEVAATTLANARRVFALF